MRTILLNYGENTSKIEATEKLRFLLDCVKQMGIDVANYSADKEMSVEEKISFKKLLLRYGVQIIDEFDAGMKIYVDKEVIGEWKKCTYKIKKDVSEVDRRKQVFVEMAINTSSVFEENK